MLLHTAEAKRLYNSIAWKKCRRAYIDTVDGLCERCGDVGKIVHHKIYIDILNVNDPNVTLNHDNLELLCQECHNREHFEKHTVLDNKLMFDENGDVVER